MEQTNVDNDDDDDDVNVGKCMWGLHVVTEHGLTGLNPTLTVLRVVSTVLDLGRIALLSSVRGW